MKKLDKSVISKQEYLISVIIPVFNVAEYLDKCLQSVVENDYKNLQIICINDGSTDESGIMLERWASCDPRITVITTENQGLSEARNTGIRAAKGDYVAFIDSDDWVHLSYFSVLLQGILNYSADISMCDMVNTEGRNIEDKQLENTLHWEKIEKKRYYLNYDRVHVWGKLYSSRLVKHAYFDRSMFQCEDIAYNMMLAVHHANLKIVYTNERVYYYFNRRKGSLNNIATGERIFRMFNYFLPLTKQSIDKDDPDMQLIFVSHAVKWALSYRYDSMFDPLLKEKSRILCVQAKELLHAAQRIPWKEKTIYITMLNCPILYRSFRIINDPSMIKWEKGKRRKREINKND